MDFEFKSLKELYDRITPALTAKKSELKKFGYYYVKEADIWNYLTKTKWQSSKSLTLAEMVSDIFAADSDKINEYVMEKLKSIEVEPYFDE